MKSPEPEAAQAVTIAMRLLMTFAFLLVSPAVALAQGTATPRAGTVALAAAPNSPLDAAARRLRAADLADAAKNGDTPLVLVGSAVLGAHSPPALFVQLQSATLCGSAGCNTSVYLPGPGGERKVLDGISGPVRVDAKTHLGMHDLIVGDNDRWVWDGAAYRDTVPAPPLHLKAEIRRSRGRLAKEGLD